MKRSFIILFGLSSLLIVLSSVTRADDNSRRTRSEKLLAEMIFETFANYYAHADTPEKFVQVFGKGLPDREKEILKSKLKKEQRPKVTYLGEGRLQFEVGNETILLRPLDLFANQYEVNNIKWVFNPKDSLEFQTNLLYKKLLNAKNRKTSLYRLMVPEAEAHPLLLAAARGSVVAARFAWPYIARASGFVLEKAGKLAGKVLEVSAVSASGGLISGAAIVSRQEGVPFERALFCIFWGLAGHVCEKEQVKAKLGEPTETFESMKFAINSCPTSKVPEFVVTVIDEKEKRRISRIMKFDNNGRVTEIQEYHAISVSGTNDGPFIVDPSRAKVYVFDGGKLSKVRYMKFKPAAYTEEFLLEYTNGPLYGKRSVVIDPRIKGEDAIEHAVKMRNTWLNSMRDPENDETFIDKDAEKSDDLKKKENWLQHAAVVSVMDKLMSAACDPVIKKELEAPSTSGPTVN